MAVAATRWDPRGEWRWGGGGGKALTRFHGDQSQERAAGEGRCGVTGDKERHQEAVGARKPSAGSGEDEGQLWLPWPGPTARAQRPQPATRSNNVSHR